MRRYVNSFHLLEGKKVERTGLMGMNVSKSEIIYRGTLEGEFEVAISVMRMSLLNYMVYCMRQMTKQAIL